MSNTQRIATLLYIIVVIIACTSVQGCDKKAKKGKELNMAMKTHYIGRFAIDVPVDMKLVGHTASLRYVEIEEIEWPKGIVNEQARMAEWDKLILATQKRTPPDGADKVIIRVQEFSGVGQWNKGAFYHRDGDDNEEATWNLLMDVGSSGVWLKSRSTLLEDEKISNRVAKNLSNIAKSYKVIRDNKFSRQLSDTCFSLEHGIVDLPYSAQEESVVRFEGHPFNLVLDFKMEMDIEYFRETVGLIENTKEMLAAAKVLSGGSMTKIRLQEREVAGMKGEESILRIVDGEERTLQFTWEFNGKEDSGEYPTTTIEMESPDGNMDEKIKIWDAILDSMRPMFVR